MSVSIRAPIGSLSTELGTKAVSNWSPACHLTYNRDTWVKLYQPPSDFADDEALLLCEDSPNIWIAWVPGHGETILDRSHFYC